MAPAAEQLIRERIRQTGPLTFANFMAIALHDPEVGYYARRTLPLGATGDYYTSPELHPAFAALLGRQLEQLWRALGRPKPFVVHEAGPGRGIFARDLLDWARATCRRLYEALEYRLDETSAPLRTDQRRLLAAADHNQRVSWVDGFPAGHPVHCIVANELLDSLPVHLVDVRDGELRELFVEEQAGRLALEPGPPSTPAIDSYFERLGLRPDQGCRAEVNLAALDWMRAAAAPLDRGLLLVLDYGYPADRLYHPRRRHGTLLCFYRHTLNSDPLARIGQQDITSHLDFTSLRWAGESAGLVTLGLISQRRLLENLGRAELRRAVQAAPVRQAERDANLRALDELVAPSGLGRILALFQQRGLDEFTPMGLVGGTALGWSNPPLRGPEHLRLADPAEAEGLLDIEAQWAELWSAQ